VEDTRKSEPMIPSWTRPALIRVGILAVACVAILVGVRLVVGSLGQSAETPPPQPSAPAGDMSDKQPIIAAVAPETTVKQDTKAPPIPAPVVGVKKEEIKTGQDVPAKEFKMISLGEAVSLIENAGKGEPVLAEKLGEGAKAQFNIDVLGANGAKCRFNVNATGKVIVEVPVATKKGPSGTTTTDRKKSNREKGSPEREREREREREDR
jgi:hypothetical protein